MDQAGNQGESVNVTEREIDIYSRRRASIFERLESGLHPSARWHDEREAWTPGMVRAENTPWAHTLAGACVWLRSHSTGRRDVSGDLLWCIVMPDRCRDEAARVRAALSAAWLDMHGQTLARTLAKQSDLEDAAEVMVEMCVTGHEPTHKVRLHWHVWRKLRESGERMLWGLADTAASRVIRALG